MTNKEKLTHMPYCKRWIDEVVAVFGAPRKIVASEGGYKVEWKK